MDGTEKVEVSIKLDPVLLAEASAAGLDVSEVAEQGLRRRLGLPGMQGSSEEREKLRQEIAQEVAWFNKHVEAHGLLSDDWYGR